MDSDTRDVEPVDDQEEIEDPEEYDEEEQPPAARMPGNVLGPALFLGAGAVAGLLIGGYAFTAALVTGRTDITLGLFLLLA